MRVAATTSGCLQNGYGVFGRIETLELPDGRIDSPVLEVLDHRNHMFGAKGVVVANLVVFVLVVVLVTGRDQQLDDQGSLAGCGPTRTPAPRVRLLFAQVPVQIRVCHEPRS